jgi:hypothetical protein
LIIEQVIPAGELLRCKLIACLPVRANPDMKPDSMQIMSVKQMVSKNRSSFGVGLLAIAFLSPPFTVEVHEHAGSDR